MHNYVNTCKLRSFVSHKETSYWCSSIQKTKDIACRKNISDRTCTCRSTGTNTFILKTSYWISKAINFVFRFWGDFLPCICPFWIRAPFITLNFATKISVTFILIPHDSKLRTGGFSYVYYVENTENYVVCGTSKIICSYMYINSCRES
jgi:hypothetical protein